MPPETPSMSSKFVVLGPLTPQLLEVSDTSASSGETQAERPAMLVKSASTSQIADHEPGAVFREQSLPSSPAGPGGIDWVEYETSPEGLEGYDQESSGTSCSGESWTQEQRRGEAAPESVFWNEKQRLKTTAIGEESITKLLFKSLTHKSPTESSRPEDVTRPPSVSPSLPTLLTPSTPISPTVARAAVRVKLPICPHPRPSPALDGDVASIASVERATRVIDSGGPMHIQDTSKHPGGCDACGQVVVGKVQRVLPCKDIICPKCYSSAISALSTSYGNVRCPACTGVIALFESIRWHRPDRPLVPSTPDVFCANKLATQSEAGAAQSVVLRIDNVPWDVTPPIVRAFLPPSTLAEDHLCPIHILLDRFDGRTKDFMYVEVAGREAAARVLSARQDQYMSGGPLSGGRKRPVTILQVPHEELIDQLRPRSAAELHGLLPLCHAALSSPPVATPPIILATTASSYVTSSGLPHFVKSRHGPLNAIMSIMSKVSGPHSPIYWDLLEVASGALAALANASRAASPRAEVTPAEEDDKTVLARFLAMFQALFGGQRGSAGAHLTHLSAQHT